MWGKIFQSGKPSVPLMGDNPLYKDIDPARLPRHTAMIMDGNGRWANGRGLLRTAGHKAGVDALREILHVANELHLEVVTVYAFSTENWKRPHEEVDFLMHLFSDYLEKELKEMMRDNMQIHFIGRMDELAPSLQKQAREAEEMMRNNTGVKFYVAMNYGGQDEIVRAAQKMAYRVRDGEMRPEDVNAAAFDAMLDTAGSPPVDLLIRTSGDQRISNFLLWQAAYAEMWFTETKWPDFTPELFVQALVDFGKRKRRFGGLDKNKI